jgi:predicted O-methyltransferase YrrM
MNVHDWPLILRRYATLFCRRPVSAPAPVGPRPARLEVDKWVLSEVVLKLARIVGTHPFPLDELLLMAAAFEYHRPEIVIDIGTHIGKSARVWYELARHYREHTAIHTIDLCEATHPEFPASELGRYVRGLPVTQHIDDGYPAAAALIRRAPDATYLIFCDGDHRYESVKRELELATMIRRGCLLVHDTFYQPGSTYNDGPYEAVEEFVRRVPVRQVVHLQTGLPGLSYIGLSETEAITP